MSGKILVIDDEIDFVDAVRMRLEACGYNIVAAHDGREGIAKAKKERPDLILLDLVMPNLDGISTLNELKSSLVTLRIPIIIITAKTESEYALDAGKLGAVDYMVKPIDMQELVDKARKYIP